MLRDVVAKICGWITTFKSVGEFAACLDPVHLALPWAAIKAILSVCLVEAIRDNHLSSLRAEFFVGRHSGCRASGSDFDRR